MIDSVAAGTSTRSGAGIGVTTTIGRIANEQTSPLDHLTAALSVRAHNYWELISCWDFLRLNSNLRLNLPSALISVEARKKGSRENALYQRTFLKNCWSFGSCDS